MDGAEPKQPKVVLRLMSFVITTPSAESASRYAILAEADGE